MDKKWILSVYYSVYVDNKLFFWLILVIYINKK